MCSKITQSFVSQFNAYHIIFSSLNSLLSITPNDWAHEQCYRSKGCHSLA